MCCGGIEQAFDTFYTMALGMLDAFYPVKSITVSNRDPVFVTPEIKSLLRKINKLRRSGKIEAANSLSEKISKIIIRRNSDTFSKTPRGSRKGLIKSLAKARYHKESVRALSMLTA